MYKLVTGPIACTAAELATVLFQVVGAKPVTILARTEPALVGGKSCPLKGLVKVASVNGIINWSYERSVNRERVRRGAPVDAAGNVEHFEAAPRSWGTRLICQTTDHKVPLVAKHVPRARITLAELQTLPADELFLELKVQKTITRQYELHGETIPEEQVTPHLRTSSNPHGVVLRDYRLDHLQELVMGGRVYWLGTPCELN
jgi:hypothetical protein